MPLVPVKIQTLSTSCTVDSKVPSCLSLCHDLRTNKYKKFDKQTWMNALTTWFIMAIDNLSLNGLNWIVLHQWRTITALTASPFSTHPEASWRQCWRVDWPSVVKVQRNAKKSQTRSLWAWSCWFHALWCYLWNRTCSVHSADLRLCRAVWVESPVAQCPSKQTNERGKKNTSCPALITELSSLSHATQSKEVTTDDGLRLKPPHFGRGLWQLVSILVYYMCTCAHTFAYQFLHR